MRRRKDDTPVLNAKRPDGWLAIHKEHGRGPYYEVKIGEWHRWCCSCGERFFFTDEDRELDPKKFILR